MQVRCLASSISGPLTLISRSQRGPLSSGAAAARHVSDPSRSAAWTGVQTHSRPCRASVAAMTTNVGECCKPGITWLGTPAGQEATIAEMNSYQTSNFSSSEGPILMLVCDIYGFQAKNIRLVADRYAELGYRVVVPDFFNGMRIEHNAGVDEKKRLIQSNPFPEKMQQCDGMLQACRNSYGGLIGVQGFCWGAKPAILLAGQKKVAAAVVNHPSFFTKEDVEGIQAPVWANFSGPTDPAVTPEQRETYEKILDSKKGCGHKNFPDMQHGWTLKGDDKDPKVQADATDAFDLAVSFFKTNMA